MSETMTSTNGKWQVTVTQTAFDGGRNIKTLVMVIFTDNNAGVRFITRWGMSEAQAMKLATRALDYASKFNSIIDYDWNLK